MSGDHNAHQSDQCDHSWLYIGSKRQSAWECQKCKGLSLRDPLAKEWVGLTDEDIEEIWGEPVGFMYGRYYDAIRALEDRLKEKNA